MLGEPNISSPANVDANAQWMREREKYNQRVKELIALAARDIPSHVVIPHPDTDPEQRARAVEKMKLLNHLDSGFDDDEDDFFYDDDDGEFDDDDFDEDDGDFDGSENDFDGSDAEFDDDE